MENFIERERQLYSEDLKQNLPGRFLIGLLCLFLSVVAAYGQQAPAQAAPSKPATGANNPADFLHITDEVMAEMSKILGLPQTEPLKKSLRSREDIRAYLVRQMDEDKEPEKRYADEKVLEKLGLLPKDFPIDSFLLDLLTEQVAGLYDSKLKEFYIADWIAPEDQREVMAHELTHALQDQHYHIDPWRDAAKPNDDAESARDAVLEGSAVAAMIDYGLHQQGGSIADLGGMSFGSMMGNLDDSPMLKKAPPFLTDSLLFPYAAGADFSQAVLRARGGWPGFHIVFDSPPVSTQQIMHPELYLHNVVPEGVTLPDLSHDLPKEWKLLDSNVLGEFGILEIFKQFIGEARANDLSPTWAGDRYAIYERKIAKGPKETNAKDLTQDMVIIRVRTRDAAEAARLFGGLSEAYERKYETRENLLRRPNFFSFDTSDGGVFLRCNGVDCIAMDGGDRKMFDALIRALGWPANPDSPQEPGGIETLLQWRPLPPIVPSEIQP
jgi:uncharacterized protein YihD (DUF1040 family)